jgi:uncharacterized protein YukE
MRIGGGGGYRATTGGTYTIKTMAVTPEPASGYTSSAIEEMFSHLDPGATAQAGAAHTAASKTLTSIADDLVKHVQVLNENWSGTAAQAAVVNFQQLHETAIGLAQASAQTGAVLSWLGETILPYYKNYKAPGNGVVGDLESLFGHNPQNSAAQAVMERLNNRLAQANDGLPPSVSLHLSLTSQNNGHSSASTSSVGSGGTGAGQAASAVGGLTSGAHRTASPVGGGVGAGGGVGSGLGGLGHGSPVSATHLAGYSPPGGSGGSGAGAGPGGALGGGTVPAGGAPGSGGPGSGGGILPISGGGVPGGGVDGPGGGGGLGDGGLGADGAALSREGMISEGMAGAAPGDSAIMGADGMIGMAPAGPGAEGLGGLAGEPGAAGAVDGAVAGDSGMTGFPMTGSAAGQRDMERRRQAWMAEDADIWAAAAELVPALIGG